MDSTGVFSSVEVVEFDEPLEEKVNNPPYNPKTVEEYIRWLEYWDDYGGHKSETNGFYD